MGRPFRRYCFYLGEKLGKTLDEILSLSSAEISEWMAFDLTNDQKWTEKFTQEKEMERQRGLSPADRANLFKQMLGGINGDSS